MDKTTETQDTIALTKENSYAKIGPTNYSEEVFYEPHQAVRYYSIANPASHAIGTTKAIETGEVEGAKSSLTIIAWRLITVDGTSIFENLI